MFIFRIILLVGIVFVAYLTASQIFGRRRADPLVSPRQRVLRICSGITLLLLLILVLAGNLLGIVFTTETASLAKNNQMVLVSLAYASLVGGLACLLLLLALMDIREVLTSYRRTRGDAGKPITSDLEGKDGQGQ